MEQPEQHLTRSLDVTGLSEEAVRALQMLVSQLGQITLQEGRPSFSSREEWIKAIRKWAASHQPEGTSADWSRESTYAGREE